MEKINKAEYKRNWYLLNREKLLSKAKERQSLNKDKKAEYDKKYVEINKEKKAQQAKNYNQNNKQKLSVYNKEYRDKKKEQIFEKRKEYRKNNKEKISNYKKEYGKNNRVKIDLYRKKKKENNSLIALKDILRGRIYSAFKSKSWKKNSGSEKLIGESFEFVHNYIEIQFKKGMSWENRSQWHIDHKIPLASAKTEEELISLFHYTNLQPLWKEDNLSKGNKIIEHQIKLL